MSHLEKFWKNPLVALPGKNLSDAHDTSMKQIAVGCGKATSYDSCAKRRIGMKWKTWDKTKINL